MKDATNASSHERASIWKEEGFTKKLESTSRT
jgi:hypothetical protein